MTPEPTPCPNCDTLEHSLAVQRDLARGQGVRLQRAKAERDNWQSAAKLSAADLFTVRGLLADSLSQRDDARIAYTSSRATVATLTTRLRIAWGVIGLLCVALGVVGVFG